MRRQLEQPVWMSDREFAEACFFLAGVGVPTRRERLVWWMRSFRLRLACSLKAGWREWRDWG
jgi:hypothetical protein